VAVPDLAQETVDYVAITRLQDAYGDTVNRRAWRDLGALFLPGATVHIDTVTNPAVDVTGPDELGSFVGGAVERFEFFEFVILNRVVDVDGDRATGRMFMCELRQERESGRFTTAFGVYRDEYAKVDGRWWFARRRYQSLARSGRGEVFALPQDAR
jgi:hypothetical protein